MKIYGCQFDIAWEDKPANFQRVLDLLAAKPPDRGALVFLPEMFNTGFSMNVAKIAEDPQRGLTPGFLSDAARQFGIFLTGSYASRHADGKVRNELVVFAPDGSRIGEYAKLHPFTAGQEAQHYTAGERICLFRWAGTTVAPFICYDLRFPEIFRHAGSGGAEVMAIIANWPAPRQEHWITLLRARAIENQAYVIGVNRCGADPKLSYFGRSIIVEPRGSILVDAGEGENVISAGVDLEDLKSYRQDFPALRDLQPRFLGL